MTDPKPTPNDRQIRSSLFPHAQQVFWEFNRAASGKPYDWHYLPAIAAALRAAADQVVPEEESCEGGFSDSLEHQCRASERRLARAELLAIAAELEVE